MVLYIDCLYADVLTYLVCDCGKVIFRCHEFQLLTWVAVQVLDARVAVTMPPAPEKAEAPDSPKHRHNPLGALSLPALNPPDLLARCIISDACPMHM